MAVTNPEPQIHDYWQRYWRSTIFLIISMQIIAVLIVGITLMVFGIVEPDAPTFWITLSAILAAVISINSIVATIITEPLKQLIAAHAQVAGERQPFHPPNPNAPRFERSGLKPILMAIYESALAPKTVDQSVDSMVDDQALVVKNAIELSSVGIALLNTDGSVAFANSAIPLTRSE